MSVATMPGRDNLPSSFQLCAIAAINWSPSVSKVPALFRDTKRPRRLCMAPAVTGWAVCRFHGARGGGPKGERNGMYRHGLNTKEAVKERRFLSDLLRQSRAML